MPALKLLSFTGSTVTPVVTSNTLTPVGDDSATIANFRPGTSAQLMKVWTQSLSAGFTQIFSAETNDQTTGLRYSFDPLGIAYFSGSTPTTYQGATVSDFINSRFPEPLTTGQSLTVRMATSGSDTTAGIGMLVYYEDQPGINQRLISPSQLQYNKTANMQILTASGVQYSTTSTALNAAANSQQLLGNTDYAVLGWTVTNQDFLGVAIKGPATAGYRIGGPGTAWQPEVTRDYFVKLSLDYGLPLIPVINSADLANTFVEVSRAGPGAQAQVFLNLLQLRGSGF